MFVHRSASVCAPTRGAFLTGRYAFRTWSDWRSEDFGKPSYLAKLGLTLATNAEGDETRSGQTVNGIDFVNQVKDQEGFNVLTYRNYYNGGGVAIEGHDPVNGEDTNCVAVFCLVWNLRQLARLHAHRVQPS